MQIAAVRSYRGGVYASTTASISAHLQSALVTSVAARRQDVDVDDVVSQLPPEVVEALPADVLQQLEDGTISEIPADVADRLKDRLSADVLDRVPSDLLEDPTNQALVAVLGVALAFALAGFLWGVVKSAMKAAAFFAIIAVIAGIVLYTNVI